MSDQFNLVGRYDPIINSNVTGVYPITVDDLKDLMIELRTESFGEKFIYTIFGNPLDSILSVRYFPGLQDLIPRADGDAYVKVGKVAFDGTILAAGSDVVITTRPATKSMIEILVGVITFPFVESYRDLDPYTKYQLFLPYVGYVDLNPTDFVQPVSGKGASAYITYRIDIITGAALARVETSDISGGIPLSGYNRRLVLEMPCTVGYELPFDINVTADISSRLATVMAGAAAVGVGVLAAPATPLLAGAAGAGALGLAGQAAGAAAGQTISTVTSEIGNMTAPTAGYRRSGGMDSATGKLGVMRPFLVVARQGVDLPDDFNDIVGTPCSETVTLSDEVGTYVQVASFTKNGTSQAIPRAALQEIQQQLKAGVYV